MRAITCVRVGVLTAVLLALVGVPDGLARPSPPTPKEVQSVPSQAFVLAQCTSFFGGGEYRLSIQKSGARRPLRLEFTPNRLPDSFLSQLDPTNDLYRETALIESNGRWAINLGFNNYTRIAAVAKKAPVATDAYEDVSPELKANMDSLRSYARILNAFDDPTTSGGVVSYVANLLFARVDPGDYTLREYTAKGPLGPRLQASTAAPLSGQFTVRPGEIVYLGAICVREEKVMVVDISEWDLPGAECLAPKNRRQPMPKCTVKLVGDRLSDTLAALEAVQPGMREALGSRIVSASYLGPAAADLQALADALRAAAQNGGPAGSSDVSAEMQDGKLVMRIGPPKTTSAADPSTPQTAPAANPQTPLPTPETPLVRPKVLADGPPAAANLGDVWTSPTDSKEMVYVPAGEFLMGTPEKDGNAYSDEKPQRRVYLDAFWIDKTEVTVAQYRRFCQATGRQMPEAPSWGWQDDHPIVNVTWDDATAYAAWAGKRLPTEAEWEKAARGTDGRQYPWGNEWDTGRYANRVNSDSIQPVGSYPSGASPYGVLDMAGSVDEWCADWFDGSYYRSAPARSPTGPPSGGYRVLRGGSWDNDLPTYFRCAFRHSYFPGYRSSFNGIRCARGPGL